MSDEITKTRDLLAPGVASVLDILGMPKDAAMLFVEEHGIGLRIGYNGVTKEYPVANADEIASGAFKDLFYPRVTGAFDSFLRAQGVTGVRELLEKRGPRGPVSGEQDDDAGPAPPGDAA